MQHDPPCVRGCYLCLLNYYNQRDHDRIDKRLIEALVRELASEAPPTVRVNQASPKEEPQRRRAESPIEVLLDATMRRHLPPFELQSEVFDGDGNLVSRPDMLFGGQRIAIYADGHDYHSSSEQIENDNRIRGRMRELGYKVLAFSGGRIAGDIDGCMREIVLALEESP
jgi:very-short-patch-repair endonuclease